MTPPLAILKLQLQYLSRLAMNNLIPETPFAMRNGDGEAISRFIGYPENTPLAETANFNCFADYVQFSVMDPRSFWGPPMKRESKDYRLTPVANGARDERQEISWLERVFRKHS
ncbi:MAG: hypothetical protein U1D30_22020 [Planctomycetota bacterium]